MSRCGRFLLPAAMVFIIGVSQAQPPDIYWERELGGSESDGAFSVLEEPDGGFIVAGMKSLVSTSVTHAWLLKLNQNGSTQWQELFGPGIHDNFISVCHTEDGGYVMCGSSWSYASTLDLYVVKTDSTGTLEWEVFYGGPYEDCARSIVQTSDGGYIVCGSYVETGQKACLLKLDADGNTEWFQTYGDGITHWGKEVIQTPEGGYLFCGCYGSGGSDADAWLVKVDQTGTVEWESTYGFPAQSDAYSVLLSADGGYAFCGWRNWTPEAYLVKTDSSGVVEWEETYNSSSYVITSDLQQTPDGGYALAGRKGGDFYLMRVDGTGQLIWDTTYDNGVVEECYSFAVTSDNGFILCGDTSAGQPPFNYPNAWIVRTYPCMEIGDEGLPDGICELSVYPNPFTGTTMLSFELPGATYVRLVIYDVNGHMIRNLLDWETMTGQVSVSWDGSDASGNPLPSGVYLALLTDGYTSEVTELVLVR